MDKRNRSAQQHKVPSHTFVKVQTSKLTIPASSFEREGGMSKEELQDSLLNHGLMRSLIVRRETGGQYTVIDGSRLLRAIWDLQEKGYERDFRWVPVCIVNSKSSVQDLQMFMAANSPSVFAHSAVEKILRSIESNP